MEIKVKFKEVGRSEVIRSCFNMTRDQIIALYGLNEPDIEYYEFLTY